MMSSECMVPKWKVRKQRQEEEGEERKRSPHVQSHHNLTYAVPMYNSNEVRELTWEDGQPGVHGLPQRWGKPGDHTLESIVHQACSQQQQQQQQHSSTSDSIGKWNQKMEDDGSGVAGKWMSKRVRSTGFAVEESRDTDTTMMTWNSFESSRSLKTARIADDDSAYHDCSENQDGEGMAKGESCRSQSSARRSRAAAIHNLSERRRRDRINEKMKALQKLVPNASKTDKASMLDEVIEYLKQLQAQVQMMSNARNMVMPLGMQQLQLSLLARMGMGMGMGMGISLLDLNNFNRNLPPSFPPLIHPAAASLGGATPFVPPPFAMPPIVPPPPPLKPNVDAATDAYNTFLAQSMNMEFLNKMSAIYRQQNSSHQQPPKKAASQSLPNDAQGG